MHAAVRSLEAALRAAPAAGPLRAPASLNLCRNDEDPVALEPLAASNLSDLVLLPSGNCMRAADVRRMRRKVDPFTNLPLPSPTRREDVDAVVRGAKRACDA